LWDNAGMKEKLLLEIIEMVKKYSDGTVNEFEVTSKNVLWALSNLDWKLYQDEIDFMSKISEYLIQVGRNEESKFWSGKK
jgi:hypothetical protein